jgi:alkylation response protein AidB-like acyl-CoA dehydrogenase
MDFILSSEQEMLTDTLGRLLDNHCDLETRRTVAASSAGYSPTLWRELAKLGLLGLHVPEDYGGMNASAVDALLVMEAFGRHLVLEPYLSTSIVGASLISHASSKPMRERLLPAIVAGELMFALAALEPASRYDFSSVETVARRSPDGYVIVGEKAVVLDGPSADYLIVSARIVGAPDGITLFLVDRCGAGVSVRPFSNIDGTRSAEVTLQDVKVGSDGLIGVEQQGLPLLERAVNRGLSALSAEAVGCMSRLVELTVQHLETRKQFGQPLARFQALQHRVAEMLIATEQARAIALYSAAKCDAVDAAEQQRATSAAKAYTGSLGRLVGELSVQLHGGMGMTDELAVGHFFKRLSSIDMTWGNTEHHTEVFAEYL